MTGRPHLVVVGAGPAGLAAAAEGQRHGLRITVVDENRTLGGQYFRGRQSSDDVGSPRWYRRQGGDGTVLLQGLAFDAPAERTLSIWTPTSGVQDVKYDALVLATGAYDRPVALPGWTLPGVLTAGAAHTLAKAYGTIPGRRVVVAGAGPFLLPVADVLAEHGSRVTVIEATPFRASVRGLPVIARDPEILRQTAGYTARLTARHVARRYGRLVIAILGTNKVEAVTTAAVDHDWIPIPGSEQTQPADSVCLGFGFVPQLELAQLVGCRVVYQDNSSDFSVWTDSVMRTSKALVYAAGELTGIAGSRAASLEGSLAVVAAASDLGLVPASVRDTRAREIAPRLRRVRRLSEWMRLTYRPRRGLWRLAAGQTIACRCEDVTFAQVEAALATNAVSPYAVKTATRLGMGLCQGRICSPFLIEWLRANRSYPVPAEHRPWVVRPPVRPIPLGDWLAVETAP